jgi:hypothetical protein
MVGAMVGTAGWMAPLPFTGEMDEFLPCWMFCPPTATGGVALDAIGGDEAFLVALAYERAVGADPAATLAAPEEEAVTGAAV